MSKYTSQFSQYKEDYFTKDVTAVYQGVTFTRPFLEGKWHYRGKPCTKDMNVILENAKERDDNHYSQFQAIV
ncbi:hypothetical protein VPT02_083 [Vibrio phage VPT02]|nr:hypothetical protein VPT02_083 [Vibrio phage VPT02]